MLDSFSSPAAYQAFLYNLYDSFPHPHIPELASTHPHHKHIHPDIKHNRVPAPELSFTRPNLPFLIAEIEIYLAQEVKS
jgi:hypothetical protein